MIGDGDRVEAVAQRLLHAQRRPDLPIGKHGVLVKIAGQREIVRQVGELDLVSFGGVGMGAGGAEKKQAGECGGCAG